MFKSLRAKRAGKLMQQAFDQQDVSRLQKALAVGASPDHPVRTIHDSRPALEQAILLGLTDHLRLLLSHAGAPPPASDLLGLAVTAPQRGLQSLTLLLQAGAEPNYLHGKALFEAMAATDEAQAQLLLSRLLEYGGDASSTDPQGTSLVESALQREFSQVSCMLISAGAELPASLESLDCSDAIKIRVRRHEEDLAIRRLLQGL